MDAGSFSPVGGSHKKACANLYVAWALARAVVGGLKPTTFLCCKAPSGEDPLAVSLPNGVSASIW